MATKKPSTTVSVKSTKQEILDAYENAMKSLKNQDSEAAVLDFEKEKPEKNSGSSKKQPAAPTPHSLVAEVNELKQSLTSRLNEVADEIYNQAEKLNEVKKLVSDSQKELEESFHIKQTATTLKNILALHEQRKAELDAEQENRKKEVERARIELDREEKERLDELKKQRSREVEEYSYTLKLTRQKEEDEYKRKQLEREEILRKREKEVDAAEKEFKDLQKAAADFEKTLQHTVAETEKRIEAQISTRLKTEFNLERKDYEREKQLADLTITNLKNTTKTQEAEIVELKKQLAVATTQVKDIAIKVIENAKKDAMQASI